MVDVEPDDVAPVEPLVPVLLDVPVEPLVDGVEVELPAEPMPEVLPDVEEPVDPVVDGIELLDEDDGRVVEVDEDDGLVEPLAEPPAAPMPEVEPVAEPVELQAARAAEQARTRMSLFIREVSF